MTPEQGTLPGTATADGASADTTVKGKLKVHDPFELIRWLALSQPDPRKAVAELVQNSLDAQATEIRMLRMRERGKVKLRIRDNGEGPLPDRSRVEALRYIATHIGHSRKRDLSPQERLELMTQGQYGIGLLGFWSLGQVLEMRTVFPGERPMRLLLYRDQPDFRIEPLRGRLPLDERYTEVIIHDIHREALSSLAGSRISDFLAVELRGQLLAREVDLQYEDRIARGRAKKLFKIRPQRFLGERIENLVPARVEGYPAIRCEIYYVKDPGPDVPPLAVYAGGSLIAESFAELGFLGLDRRPWTDRSLTGFVDFPALSTTPGSRRGVLPDAAATVFAMSLETIEPNLLSYIESARRRRSDAVERTLLRDLQRAFRELYRDRPRYALLPVRKKSELAGAAEYRDAPRSETQTNESPPKSETAAEGSSEPQTAFADWQDSEELDAERLPDTPPGPLAALRVRPKALQIPPGGQQRIHVTGVDASGREIDGPLSVFWSPVQIPGIIEPDPDRPNVATFLAEERPGKGSLIVTAESRGHRAEATVDVVVGEKTSGRLERGEGMPAPELIHDPNGSWRSRFVGDHWQVNSAHPDYQSVAEQPRLKLRYLMLLFAKEIVLRSNHDPRFAEPLEQLIEVATFADRQLADKKGRSGGKP